MAEFPVIRIRNLRCPTGLDPWRWQEIVDEIGELIVARSVGVKQQRFRCSTEGCDEIHVQPMVILDYDDEAMKILVKAIQGDRWEPDDPEAWKQGDGEDDERTFGPDPDWWRQ